MAARPSVFSSSAVSEKNAWPAPEAEAGGWFSSLKSSVADAWDRGTELAGDVYNGAVETTRDGLDAIQERLEDTPLWQTLDDGREIFQSEIVDTWSKVEDVRKGVASAATDLYDNFTETVGSGIDAGVDALGSLYEGTLEKADTYWGRFTEIQSERIEAIEGFGHSAAEGLDRIKTSFAELNGEEGFQFSDLTVAVDQGLHQSYEAVSDFVTSERDKTLDTLGAMQEAWATTERQDGSDVSLGERIGGVFEAWSQGEDSSWSPIRQASGLLAEEAAYHLLPREGTGFVLDREAMPDVAQSADRLGELLDGPTWNAEESEILDILRNTPAERMDPLLSELKNRGQLEGLYDDVNGAEYGELKSIIASKQTEAEALGLGALPRPDESPLEQIAQGIGRGGVGIVRDIGQGIASLADKETYAGLLQLGDKLYWSSDLTGIKQTFFPEKVSESRAALIDMGESVVDGAIDSWENARATGREREFWSEVSTKAVGEIAGTLLGGVGAAKKGLDATRLARVANTLDELGDLGRIAKLTERYTDTELLNAMKRVRPGEAESLSSRLLILRTGSDIDGTNARFLESALDPSEIERLEWALDFERTHKYEDFLGPTDRAPGVAERSAVRFDGLIDHLPRKDLHFDGWPTLPGREARNFIQADPVAVPKGTRIFRVIDATPRSFPDGSYWTYDLPRSKAEWRSRFAVLKDWSENGYYVEYVVESEGGLKAWVGKTSAQQLEEGWVLPGGETQIWIPPGTVVPSERRLTLWEAD